MAQLQRVRLDFGDPPAGLIAELQRGKVFRETQLSALISDYREEWSKAQRSTIEAVMRWMLEHTRLHQIFIQSELRPEIVRYVWGEANPTEVAWSLTKGYFCHATAATFHGLLTYNPDTIYINREQSPKPPPGGTVTQEALDRAFAKPQRLSRDAYHWGHTRAVVLNGKQSRMLGVEERQLTNSNLRVMITGLERTLVDQAVRPDYSGGPLQVLESFRNARSRVSVSRLLQTLDGLDHKYPYHQAIGFYMDRAGYSRDDLEMLARLGTSLDFYVGYGIHDRDFDPTWRVHFPRSMSLAAP
jgi:hypothetical protein